MRSATKIGGFIGAAGMLLGARTALASANYPSAVQAHLALSSQPSCALCHLNGTTGIGTVNTPFGVSMRARGLVFQNVASLNTALDALAAEGTDSDGDGVGDIQELKNGTDPNVAGGSGGSTLTPKYGCGGGDLTQPMNPASVGGAVSFFALALAAVVNRRRRS
jgi:hypothetical protein